MSVEQKQQNEKKTIKNKKIFFENLFTNSLEAIAVLDQNLKIIEVNQKFEELFEISKADIINKHALGAVEMLEDPEDIKEGIEIVANGNEWEAQVRFIVNDQIKYSNVHIFSVENDLHSHLTYIVIDDITESKQREKELKEAKERLELAVEGANIGIWDWDVKEEYIHYNKNWAQMLGYQLSELNNDLNTWLDCVHPDDKDQALKDIRDHLQQKTDKYLNEHRLKTKSGKWKWIRDIGRVTERNEDGDALRIVGVHIDIDQEKRAAEKIEYLSNHDELTGLYNRRYFNEEIKRLHDSRRYPISIIVSDLNRLKQINDNYGHLMGDKYIKLTAKAFEEDLRNEDLAARVGGDEFAAILPETDNNTAEAVIERIYKNIESVNTNNDLPKKLSIAIGVETIDCSEQDCEHNDLKKTYQKADQKMYQQKFANREICKR